MIARRQVFLSFLSLMAALTVPGATRASPLFDQTRFPLEPDDEGLLPAGGEPFNLGTVIKVIGVGGAGGNIVDHMIAGKTHGIEFIYANTDAQALSRSAAHKTVQLGTTGLREGGKPDKGREAAQAAEQDIRSAIDGANILLITAGMGGGTGTGAAPVIARIAKEMGILTVGLVTKPFDWEGEHRMSNADEGLAALEANVDSLIVLFNDKLLEVLGDDITLDGAFAHANDVMKNAVGGIAEIINVPGGLPAIGRRVGNDAVASDALPLDHQLKRADLRAFGINLSRERDHQPSLWKPSPRLLKTAPRPVAPSPIRVLPSELKLPV